MKINCVILFFILCSSFSFSQIFEYEDETIDSNIVRISTKTFLNKNLDAKKGSLKLTSETRWTCLNGNYLSQERFEGNSIVERNEYDYNVDGTLQAKREYRRNGALNRRYTYHYQNSMLVSYDFEYDLVRRNGTHVITYDSIHNMRISYNIHDDTLIENKIEAELNSIGKPVAVYSYKKHGERRLITENVYDSLQRLDTTKVLYPWPPHRSFVIKYHYDSINRIIGTEHYQLNGMTFKGKERFEYHSNGNIMNALIIDPYEDWEVRRYTYRFDERRNWIERSEWAGNTDYLIARIKRKIKYFN